MQLSIAPVNISSIFSVVKRAIFHVTAPTVALTPRGTREVLEVCHYVVCRLSSYWRLTGWYAMGVIAREVILA